MMGASKNPSKFKKDGMPDQYIAISGDLKHASVESRSGYGKPNPTTQIERFNHGKYKGVEAPPPRDYGKRD